MRHREPIVRELREPPTYRLGPRLLLIGGLLAVAPFAVDAFNICKANWDIWNGVSYPYISTPAIDWTGQALASLRRAGWKEISPYLRDPAWKPVPTIMFAIGWAFVAGLFLRGSVKH